MSDGSYDYDAVEAALSNLKQELDPAEFHGTLCGLLCGLGPMEEAAWLGKTLPEVDRANLLTQEPVKVLRTVYDITLEQLNDPECEFELLLLDDDFALIDRVEALGNWCQGFLLGLSASGRNDLQNCSPEASEFVEDLVEISRAGRYALEDDQDDENAYMELVEYLRVGILLLNEELNPMRAPPKGGDAPVIH